MLMNLALAAALATNGAPVTAAADHVIHVGDGTISGARLKPYTNAWMFSATLKDGTRKDQGIWTDVLRYRDLDGKHLLERVQGMTYANGMSSVTINRFDPVTLAPIYSEQHTPDGRIIKRTFAGSHVETHVTKPGASEQVTTADLPTPVYDFNGGMYGTLIAAQPLRIGYSGQLPAVGEFDDHYAMVPFNVVRREVIRAGFKGKVNAWVVEVGGENPMTFWIGDDAPYILRLTFIGPKSTASFDMIG
jgi:hypothetical protein